MKDKMKYSQWNDTLANVNPKIIPGEDQIIIFLRPIISMYFNAKSVKRKFVPDTMSPTAVG